MVRPQTAQKITSSASRAESAVVPPKLTKTPSAPPAIAVAIPTRKPPKAVAKNTAGKYGVKNTSGRIWARPHRASVASDRQQPAKPMLKSGEGWEVPCQPLALFHIMTGTCQVKETCMHGTQDVLNPRDNGCDQSVPGDDEGEWYELAGHTP